MRFKIGTIGLLAAAFASTTTVAPAYAADPSGYRSIIRNEQTGLCFDSDFDGNVYTKTCTTNNPYQMWWAFRQEVHGSLGYMIQNHNTGLCLTALNEESVRMMPCTANYQPQHWIQITLGASNALINQSALPMTALDSNSKGHVYLKKAVAGNRYQSWLFYKV